MIKTFCDNCEKEIMTDDVPAELTKRNMRTVEADGFFQVDISIQHADMEQYADLCQQCFRSVVQWSVENLPTTKNIAEVKEKFHHLWSLAVGTPNYDKKRWKEIEGILYEGL